MMEDEVIEYGVEDYEIELDRNQEDDETKKQLEQPQSDTGKDQKRTEEGVYCQLWSIKNLFAGVKMLWDV